MKTSENLEEKKKEWLLGAAAAAAAKSLQSCLTLCDPTDGSQPGSPIPGILQARTLEWVAISFSNAWKWKVKVKLLSRVRLFVTPWITAYQAPLPMGFSRQEYWSAVPLPSPITQWVHIKCQGLSVLHILTQLILPRGFWTSTIAVSISQIWILRHQS